MTLNIAATDGNENQASTSLTGASGMTASAGAIIVVVAVIENASASSYNSISSISDNNGNTYQKRNQVQYETVNTGEQYVDIEIWWAYSAESQSANKVTVNIEGTPTVDGASFVSFAVTGFTGSSYQTNPWDSSAATAATWIATYNSASQTSSIETSSVISTNNANTLAFAFFGSGSNIFFSGGLDWPTAGTIGAGSTAIGLGYCSSAGSFSAFSIFESAIFSSIQTDIAASFTVDGGEPYDFALMPDVLSQTGGSSGSGTFLTIDADVTIDLTIN